MKTARLAGIGLILLFALGLTGLVLTFAQRPVLTSAASVTVPDVPDVPTEINAVSTYTYTSSAPAHIPDGCGAYHVNTINVPENLYIYDIRLGLKVTHAQRGDLEFHLRAPDSAVNEVLLQSNSASENFNVLFDMTSPDYPESPPGDGNHDPGLPYYEYIWHPQGDFGRFYQHPSLGVWQLEFCDGNIDGFTGQIEQWQLILDLGPAMADLDESFKMGYPLVGISETIYYEINLQNTGGLTATGVHVSDVLPEPVDFISGSLVCETGICNYDVANREITWDGDIMPFGREHITFSVQPLTYGFVENVAIVTAANITATSYWLPAWTTVSPALYYRWDFEMDDDGFVGQNGWEWGDIYVLPFSPGGGISAWGTGLMDNYSDTEPIVLTKTVDLSDASANSGLVLNWWEYYSFADGDYGSFRINGNELYVATGNSSDQWQESLINIDAYAGQPNVLLEWTLFPNNDDTTDKGWFVDNVAIYADVPAVDLSIFKDASANPALIGAPLIYTVTVHNHGPYTATQVDIFDELPPEVQLNSITPIQGATTCEEESLGMIFCTHNEIFPGEAIAIVIETTPIPTATQEGTQIVNYARVSSPEADFNLANNYFHLRTTLVETPVTAPQVYSVTPGSATIPISGTLILIDGDNFTDGMLAYLGDYALFDVTRITNKKLEARVPQTVPPGAYDLEVVNTDQESGILLNAFTVLDGSAVPTPQMVFPNRGLSGIPANVFVDGDNFSPDTWAALYLGNTEIAQLEGLAFIDNNLLRGMVPSDVPIGVYDLRVGDARGFATLPGAYTVEDPLAYDDLFMLHSIDLWNHPPSVQQSTVLTTGVNVRRIGGQSSLVDIDVDYYWNAPDASGIYIGASTIPSMMPQSVISTALTHTVTLSPGVYTLYAVVDPSNTIPEMDETNNIISGSVRIHSFDPGFSPSQITTFTINLGFPYTDDPQVRLDLSATPTPSYVLYQEYQYIQSANAWVQVAQSGWLPYATAASNFAWRLQSIPGIHYIQAWVADGRGNISPNPALAYVNLLPQMSHLTAGEVHIYRAALTPGNYIARLILDAGEVDFYVWALDGSQITFMPVSRNYVEVPFTIPVAGTYQFEVEGYTSADYHIEFMSADGIAAQQMTAGRHIDGIASPAIRGRGTGLTGTEPGDNTDVPESPTGHHEIYIPAVFR
ncbi:MAG TPA: hypothetical protein EYP88_07880 [Anaerolineales bacterium]|nr:hypothetical protein [Anaerolineales bacterium]